MKTCSVCSKEFEADKESRKYCSRKCYHSKPVWNKGAKGLQVAWNKKEWPVLKCENCNKDYSVQVNQVARSRFCSRLCTNRWISKNTAKSGPDNPMYKNGSGPAYYRREGLRIHGEKCNRCDELDIKKLLVHHKDHDRKNNPPNGSNWEVLCRRCHQLHHDCASNLPIGPRPKTFHKLICKNCKTEFSDVNRDKKFCCSKCHSDFKTIHHKLDKTCIYCGNSFVTIRESQKYCGRSCNNKHRAST